MSGLDGRADRLYEGLSARERAILELEASKSDETPSALIRWTMPESQAVEFNGYMRQMRGVARGVGAYSLVLEQEIANARLQLILLSTLVLWGEDRSVLLDYLAYHTLEPCTAEQYAEHLAATRAEDRPVEVAADAVIDARGTWQEMPDEAPEVQSRRYEAEARPIRRELQALVASGTLAGRGRGAALVLNAGAFDDWLGVPSVATPEWGRGYEVLPDAEVEWRAEARESVRQRIASGPHRAMHVLPLVSPTPAWLVSDEYLTESDRLMRGIAARLAADLRHLAGALAAVEVAVAEVQESLDGHDPLHPSARAVIERSRTDLEESIRLAAPLIGATDAHAVDQGTLDALRVMIRG